MNYSSSSPSKGKRPSFEDNLAAYNASTASAISKRLNQRAKDQAVEDALAKVNKLNQQLKDSQAKEASSLGTKIQAEKELAVYKKNFNDKYAINPSDPILIDIKGWIYNQEQIIIKSDSELKTANAKSLALIQQINQGVHAHPKQIIAGAKAAKKTTKKSVVDASPAGTGPASNQGPNPPLYKYNAPMVKTAYLTPFGPQGSTSYRGMNSGTFTDAATAWSGNLGAKGTIQMSRVYASYNPTTDTKNVYSDNLYGFKFLYNPTEVAMAWGTSTEANWDYVSLGLDKASVVALGILKSTITFSVLLNRIGDMNFLEDDGRINPIKLQDFPDGTRAFTGGFNPYPTVVSPEEGSLIYKKGTMYDLEYLFRTIMGLNSEYTSLLNGKTSDRGWLNAAPVELHLGDGLRYLVRISTLDVNHIIFNDRMVPMLSTINFTCHRFYDGTDVTGANDPSKNASQPTPSSFHY
jgi:hypothetical protein